MGFRVLVIHLADHCNLNCAGCARFAPLAPPTFCDLEKLEKALQRMTSIRLFVRHIDLMGGEPLLHPNVIEAFRIVRQRFPGKLIRLVTNGLLLPKMPPAFFDACIKYDILVSFTVYPIAFDYEQLKELCKEKGIRWGVEHDKRLPSWRTFLLDESPSYPRSNYFRCRRNHITLVGSRLYPCPCIPYVKYVNNAFGCSFSLQHGNFIDVSQLNLWSYLWFVLPPKPFCRHCCLDKKKIVDWRLSKREKSEWVV